MTFIVRWSKQAERFLGKLPRQIARRIVSKVNSITGQPFHYLEHHHGSDFFKLRVGDYRLLVHVDLKINVISVRVLGHRRNIYKGNLRGCLQLHTRLIEGSEWRFVNPGEPPLERSSPEV